MEMQCVWIASKVLLAQPFDSIQSHHACVDLDHHLSSTAWASTTFGIYLEHCCHWECLNLALFGTPLVPLSKISLKFHLAIFAFQLEISPFSKISLNFTKFHKISLEILPKILCYILKLEKL